MVLDGGNRNSARVQWQEQGGAMGAFALHTQARNSSRKANGFIRASVSLPILINPSRRYHRLRRGGLATQKGPFHPRGPWGTWDNPDFHTSSVSQQALVRFAGGARSISKHCFPAPVWPWDLLHLPLVSFPALPVPREQTQLKLACAWLKTFNHCLDVMEI